MTLSLPLRRYCVKSSENSQNDKENNINLVNSKKKTKKQGTEETSTASLLTEPAQVTEDSGY